MTIRERCLWIYLIILSCSYTGYSQKSISNYFDIVANEAATFDYQFKNEINPEANTSLYKKHKKFARWQWFWQQRINHKGNLNTYHKELFSTSNIKKLRKHKIGNNQNTSWKIIGSETYPEGTNPSGIKGIGRIDAIIVNPKNKEHIIIGTRAGGIWETKNSNDSIPHWKCLTNNLPIFTVNDLKISNNTVYASTSNLHPIMAQGNTSYGLGVIKKKLNSHTWLLPNQSFESRNISISKNNKNVMYSVGEKHIYKSIDAGTNWKKLADPIKDIYNSKFIFTNIEINPYNDNKIIATGRINVYQSTNNKQQDLLLFMSDNGGETWQNLTLDLENFINKKFKDTGAKDRPISLTTNLKNHIGITTYNKTTFLCIQQMYAPNYAYFIKLDATWNKYKLYNSLSKNKTFYYKTDNVDVEFKFISTSKILIGNRKLRLINNENHTIKNLDNTYKYLHQDIRAINFDKKTGRLLIGTDGGINKTLINNNLKRSPYFSNISGNLNLFLAFNMSYINKNNTRTVRIGNQDTGYYRTDKINNLWTNWTRFGPFGEGMIYTDPSNPSIVYRINAGGHGGNVQKSINSGKNFTNTKIKVGSYVSAPLEIDSNNSKNLIFDNFKRYDQYPLSLSNNQMTSAIDISNGIDKLYRGKNLALAISKKKPTVLYIARKELQFKKTGINNSFYKSENLDFNTPSAITYTDLSSNIKKLDSTILKSAFITHIELNDTNENELWISFGNLENGKKVFHSIDGGLHWKNISTNLPNVPVNTIKHSATNNALYIGNDYGVYHYNKTSKQWSRYGNDLPVAIVTSIEIDNTENEIIAATHGRSVWIAPLIKNNDYIVDTNNIWTKDKNIEGDLIIKKGATLILNNNTIKATNIIIEKNATLKILKTTLTSNYKKTASNYFNTNINIQSGGMLSLSNSTIKNYTIDLKPYSTIKINGNKKNIFQHTLINVAKNANYLQHKNSKLVLKDINSHILLSKGYLLGSSPYNAKTSDLKFNGNGSIKIKKD